MAKKFKFKADALIKLREHAERDALQHLAEAQKKLNEIEQRIIAVREEMDREDKAVRDELLSGKVDVNYVGLYRRRLMSLHKQLIAHSVDLRQAAMEVAIKRSAAADALKQRKIITQLKENRKQSYIRELDKAEQKEADEGQLTRMVIGDLSEGRS